MTPIQIGSLVGFSVLLASGQVLFKVAAISAPDISSVRGITAMLALPTFWSALLVYGSATVLWLYLLQSVPLSQAYPFAALGFVFVPLASAALFAEPIGRNYIFGTLMIFGGLLIISRG